MSDQTCLLMFDADRIKDFVFATGRLKEIRGASQLVRDATDKSALIGSLKLKASNVIFAEGGSGLLRASSPDQAVQLCETLRRDYHKLTGGATLTAVWQPLTDDFGDTVQSLARRLRLEKDTPRPVQPSVQSPFTRPCASCGTNPAVEEYRQDVFLCAMCLAKRQWSDQLRPSESLLLSDTVWGPEYIASLPAPQRPAWQAARLFDEMDDLAAVSRPDNYIGFLYADGNGLGDRLQKARTEPEYRQFSQRVSVSLRAALWLALQRHFPAPRNGLTPFEVIALGGDDLILLTVADQAVPLAITLSRLFQHISAGLSGLEAEAMSLDGALAVGKATLTEPDPTSERDPLTLSIGVVLSHPGQPILNLEKRGRELLKSAKLAYGLEPALDFHVVTSPTLRNLTDIRREEYVVEQARLTARPLRIDEADCLLESIAAFKSGGEREALPRNKLHALYEALFAGEDAASFEAFFLRSRLSAEQRVKLDRFFKDFGIEITRPAGETAPVLPWGKRRDEIFTVFTDVVELYEFVQAEAPAAARAEEDRHDALQD